VRIGDHDTSKRIFIVAEIGNNHEGSFENAQKLVEHAAASGVDAVKFQTYRTRNFTSGADPERFARLQRFELTHDQFTRLAELARSLGIGFFSTPLDLPSVEFLDPLVQVFKVASGDNDFFPLLARICKTGKPLIVSSGLADLERIRSAYTFVESEWARLGIQQECALMHCVSSYPVPDREANLRAIPVIFEELGCVVGYSDHTLGPDAMVAAAALGARILEKHFTLDKQFSSFRDHQLSADPPEMRAIVERVRRTETLLGAPTKVVQPSEEINQRPARRSIRAGKDLEAGHELRIEDLIWLRPAEGLPPGAEDRLLGRRLQRDVRFGELLLPTDVA
jgi:N,N'-diacetyllegionaminate synthase